jgi:two-component system, response regulator PdtaR
MEHAWLIFSWLQMIANIPHAPVVLIVEDEPLLRMLAADALAEKGIQVIEAHHARGALSALVEHRDVDVLFTDINMPGDMDGVDLAREVHRRWPHISLLITSGRERLADSEIPDDGRFVPKPYDLDELAEQILELPGRH